MLNTSESLAAARKARKAAYDRSYKSLHRKRLAAAKRLYDAQNKEHIAARRRKYHKKNLQDERDRSRKWRLNNKDKIKAANHKWYLENREKQFARKRAWVAKNKERHKAVQRAWMEKNYARILWLGAKRRAAKLGIKFNIEPEDILIPETCPIFGLVLKMSEGAPSPNSPSIDRIVAAKGYVKGNIAVISHYANRLKAEGTAADHRRVAEWIEEQERVAFV